MIPIKGLNEPVYGTFLRTKEKFMDQFTAKPNVIWTKDGITWKSQYRDKQAQKFLKLIRVRLRFKYGMDKRGRQVA